VVTQLREGVKQLMQSPGITAIEGEARFVDAHTIEVAGEKHDAKNIVIATGSAPKGLPIPGAELAMTSDDILSMTKHYNQLAGGKWAGLMDAAPRRLPVFGKTHAQLQPNSLDSRYIARNAVSYHQATPGCLPIQMLGHSMQAVSIPKDGTLLFQFTTKQQGNAILYTAMIPTHPNDKGDLRYQIQIDDQPAIILSLKQPYRSEVWKQNVLRGQALSRTAVRLTKGSHTLRIKALDAHIIMDQWMVDFQTDRQFYVIPAETEHSQGETVS
jgi:hypothetical protein